MIAALGRIMIYTHKVEEMAAFYARHFGFTAVRRDGDRIVELVAGYGGVDILLHPAAKGQRSGQALVKLVFDVAEVDSFCANAKAEGLEFGTIHQVPGYSFANA